MLALTHGRLVEVLDYTPETGVFIWRTATKGTAVGTIAGFKYGKGYIGICIDGHHYLAHRLAWFYATGDRPALQVDHINGDRSDNRFENLRLATRAQNNANSVARKKNKSGLKGVTFHKGRWRAAITHDGSHRHLGYFGSPEEAHDAYTAAAKEMFGTYSRSK